MADQPLTELRTQEDYKGLSRSVAANHFNTEVKKSEASADAKEATGEIKTATQRKLHLLKEFTTKTVWQWLKYYVINRFGKKADYKEYTGEDKGIYRITEEETTIGVVADWATFTFESCEVATKMAERNPHFTVHLGDTYYVGEPKEIAANFLGNECPWPRGSQGSFVLLGNHEMYARGIAYYRDLLPALGMKGSDGTFRGQGAAFFCLENDHWRILGLDTGYHSIGKIPLLEMIPFLSPNCRFDDKLMNWLAKDVKLGDPADKRGIVVLTHHQYLSAFKGEAEYTKPAEQLASLIGKDRPIVWLFGHEHKFSMYEKAQLKAGVTAYGRCIGHGGMPIELGFKKSEGQKGFSKLVMVDERETSPGSGLGFNGYVLLRVNGASLDIDYCDKNGVLITEQWVSENGSVKGSVTKVADPFISENLKAGRQW